MASKQPPAFQRQAKRGGIRRVPPMIFPALLGVMVFGLGLRGVGQGIGAMSALAEAVLGALVLAAMGCYGAYGRKVTLRVSVLRQEVQVLPGQLGLAAASVGLGVLGLIIQPYAGFVTGLLAVAGALALAFVSGQALVRCARSEEPLWQVTPVWGLIWGGWSIFGMIALSFGAVVVAAVLGAVVLIAAVVLGGIAMWQGWLRIPPAPLRPLLALHLWPWVGLAILAQGLDWHQMAQGALLVASLIILGGVLGAGWIATSGYSFFWGAMTGPLAAWSWALWVNGWSLVGGVALVAAGALAVGIAYQGLQSWMKGNLAVLSNAAEA